MRMSVSGDTSSSGDRESITYMATEMMGGHAADESRPARPIPIDRVEFGPEMAHLA